MQYYDLLSSEEKERILNEQLLDKMEEAEEIENSLPTGYARHDNDEEDEEEQKRHKENMERERESERLFHKPYGHRFRGKKDHRRAGYTPQYNNDDHKDNNTNKKQTIKPYGMVLHERLSRRLANENRNRDRSNHKPYKKRYSCKPRRPPK